MSMNFSEFKRKLGAEPRNEDPEFLRARHSSPEFKEAAEAADRFEAKLERAASVPLPEGLIDDILALAEHSPERSAGRNWWPMAVAASVLIAVGAAGLGWKMNHRWESVEEYLVDHYRHDGNKMVVMADGSSANDVQAVLSKFDVSAAPAFAEIVSVIKYCPTPDGKGVHMVVSTENGPVTVIYMPHTQVADREMLAFDNVEALLVDLQSGSAAIIGAGVKSVSELYTLVQASIIPTPISS